MPDPKDEIARMRAEMDQGKEGLKEMAGSLWAFYDALTEEGFNASEALAIVIAMFTASLGGGGSDA